MSLQPLPFPVDFAADSARLPVIVKIAEITGPMPGLPQVSMVGVQFHTGVRWTPPRSYGPFGVRSTRPLVQPPEYWSGHVRYAHEGPPAVSCLIKVALSEEGVSLYVHSPDEGGAPIQLLFAYE